MSRHEAKRIRKQLEEKLDDLTPFDARRTELAIVPESDSLEQVQSRMAMDLTVRAVNIDWQTAKQVRTALERIRTGEYGVCEACDDPIAAKRLEAIPWASLCTRCQSAREATGATEWSSAAGQAA